MDNLDFALKMRARRRAKYGPDPDPEPFDEDALCIRFAISIQTVPYRVAPLDHLGRVLDGFAFEMVESEITRGLIPMPDKGAEVEWYRQHPGVRIISFKAKETPPQWEGMLAAGRLQALPIKRYFTKEDIR